MFLEGTLQEKLRKIEALHAGTKVDGEREAARLAAERIRARLAELRGQEKDEHRLYRLPDPWQRRLFLALCRRYGLTPFREAGRRYSTVQVRMPKTFHERTLWPEFLSSSPGACRLRARGRSARSCRRIARCARVVAEETPHTVAGTRSSFSHVEWPTVVISEPHTGHMRIDAGTELTT
jgi:hypothetical protein